MKKLLGFALLFFLSAIPAFGQSAAGSITAANTTCTTGVCVSMTLSTSAGAATITVGGSFSGTLNFELSGDNGVTWTAAPTASTTSAGVTNFNVAGYSNIRVRGNPFASGTANVTIFAGAGSKLGPGSSIVTSVTGSAPVQSSGGTTPAISCPTCSTFGSSPIFSTSDTLSDTVTTEQLFATNMTIPANVLVSNIAYKFIVEAEWTTVVTIPNATFQIYLCPTQGSLTGCKNVYKSTQTTMASGAGTFNSAMEFGFVGETAAGATATVMMMSAGSTAANCPFGRSTVAASQGNIPTNANLFLQFSVTYASAAGAGANTLSIRALVAEPSPLH